MVSYLWMKEDGSITETRKTLLRILEKKEEDLWVEVYDEVYDYFEERVFIENNLEANRRLKEQFMNNWFSQLLFNKVHLN